MLTPQAFVQKWRQAAVKERSGYQEHFIDLCRLIGHPTPVEDDPSGARYAFEAGADKQRGGQGWADVWKRGFFAWEYKGKHANLNKAYQQLLQYRESLQNPPLLVVSDMEQIAIHTNFTNTVKQVVTIQLDDLLTPQGMQRLRDLFTNPEAFRAPQSTQYVTEQAAAEFAKLATLLRRYGEEPQAIAHFLIRLLFCLFAEDVGLLPQNLFSRLVANTRTRAPLFVEQLELLFAAMRDGGFYAMVDVPQFNGRLFDDARALPLDSAGMEILLRVSELDWSSIEPSILGTLFERSLDPAKRAQLGAHYTSRDDILLIIEPVLMAPLRRRWAAVQQQARDLAARRDAASGASSVAAGRAHNDLRNLLTGFAAEIAAVTVLDPACGSANFLYVALKQLLDLEKEVITLAQDLAVGGFFPSVSPEQLYGIEVNEYAHELAQVTVWIGYIQWLRDNGFGAPSQPILKPLDTIRKMDALLSYNADGAPIQPPWPNASVIVGNPPFLGGNKIRKELGDDYVNTLFKLYEGRVPAFADLVCYWFERSREMIEQGKVQRAGLLATSSIRGGANRKVLDLIKQTGDIFMAWADREWILDGAAVRVSMVGFDAGYENERQLNGNTVSEISPDLTSGIDLTQAKPLSENADIAFIGGMKKGAFDIDAEVAVKFLTAPLNPNGRPNSDVVRPWINGLDITRRPRGMFIIDFGVDMPEEDAALYEQPFTYVIHHVKPERDKVRNPLERSRWWLHGRSAPDLRQAIQKLRRYIGTPRNGRHRIFVYVPADTLPDGQVVVIARDSDYWLGVLHSRPHEIWSLRMGTFLGVGNDPRYTPTTTFETYPFPWPPGQEPQGDPLVEAIGAAARRLVELRENWLNPQDSGFRIQDSGGGQQEAGGGNAESNADVRADQRVRPDAAPARPDAAPARPDAAPARPDAAPDLKQRTLTNLYNQRPAWLANAHAALDKAVFAAYGWPDTLSDSEILGRLLELNAQRSGKAGKR